MKKLGTFLQKFALDYVIKYLKNNKAEVIKKANAKVQNLLTKGSLNHLKYQLKKEPIDHFKSISKNIR